MHCRFIVPMRALIASALLVGCCAVFALPQAPAFAQLVPGQAPAPAPAEGEGAAGGTGEDVAEVDAQIRALIKALRDDTAREAIIRRLEESRPAAPGETAPAGVGPAPAGGAATEPGPGSVGARVALFTQQTAEATAHAVESFLIRVSRAPRTFSTIGDVLDSKLIVDVARDLFLVIATTYAVFLVLRLLARRVYRVLGRAASQSGLTRTIMLSIASAGIDALVVVAAWAAGYALSLSFFGDTGTIALRKTLYLNAFLVVEIARVLLRAVLSPATADLRFVPISDQAARYLTLWLTVLIGILGYGYLLAVPIVQETVPYLTGRAFSATISLVAIVLAAALVVRNRGRVAARLVDRGEASPQLRWLRAIAPYWYVPVLGYLGWLLVSVIVRPYAKLLPLLTGTVAIIVAVLAGLAVTGIISRAMQRGISLPPGVTERLPLLERRLNTFVPQILFVLRFVVFAIVIAFTLHIIGFINLDLWLSSETGVRLTGTFASVAVILLAAFLVWLALSSWVEYRLNPNLGRLPTAREQTLLTLLRNAATVALLVITLMFALSELGLDIAPLLASAGVVGLAIGFGAQKLVQDIITGIFIQFENAINVGDVVTVGGTSGVVERLTIRSVSLRDLQGVYHIIPFSSVDMVSNYMRGFAFYVCDMGVAYREDIEEAKAAMMDAYDELRRDEEHRFDVIGDMEWFGLESFGASAIVLRSRIKTKPGTQWGVGRAYNGIVKRIFDERGIEIPFPHQTIYFGEDKKGKAPPVHVSVERMDPVSAAPGEAEPAAEADEGEAAAPARRRGGQ